MGFRTTLAQFSAPITSAFKSESTFQKQQAPVPAEPAAPVTRTDPGKRLKFGIAALQKRMLADLKQAKQSGTANNPGFAPPERVDSGFAESASIAERASAEMLPSHQAGTQSRERLVPRQTVLAFRPDNHIAAVEKKFASDVNAYLAQDKDGDVVTARAMSFVIEDIKKRALQNMDGRFQAALGQFAGFQPDQREKKESEVMKWHGIAEDRIQRLGMQQWLNKLAAEDPSANVQWEMDKGPLLIKRRLPLMTQLALVKKDIAGGTYGSVSIFETPQKDQMIAKVAKIKRYYFGGKLVDALDTELNIYKEIYDKAGTHPNLVNTYGIADVSMQDEIKRALVMDAVPGPDGEKFYTALRNCWSTGKISHEEYWGAHALIAKRLLSVTAHMGKAGKVHNDIKPDNFLVHEGTGEPIVIDLGISTDTGTKWATGTPDYFSDDPKKHETGVDERSDVFMVGATVVSGVEDWRKQIFNREKRNFDTIQPRQGIYRGQVWRPDAHGKLRYTPINMIESSYTRFISALTHPEKESRKTLKNAEDAKELEFLYDSHLDDDACKEVIKKVIALSKLEDAKPAETRWQPLNASTPAPRPTRQELVQEFKDLHSRPNLSTYAKLSNAREFDPELRTAMDRPEISQIRMDLEIESGKRAKGLIASSRQFDAGISILADVPAHTVKSGVDENGARLSEGNADPVARWAQRKINATTSLAALKAFSSEANVFLRDAAALGTVSDQGVGSNIASLRKRAKMVEQLIYFLETGVTAGPKTALMDVPTRDELQRQYRGLIANPSLRVYANLSRGREFDLALRTAMDRPDFLRIKEQVERQAGRFAIKFLESATWFDAGSMIAASVQEQKSKIGAEHRGKRLMEDQAAETPLFDRAVRGAQIEIKSISSRDQLITFAEQACDFLRDAASLDEIGDPTARHDIAELKKRVDVAQTMIELLEKGSSGASRSKPDSLSVRERAALLQPKMNG